MASSSASSSSAESSSKGLKVRHYVEFDPMRFMLSVLPPDEIPDDRKPTLDMLKRALELYREPNKVISYVSPHYHQIDPEVDAEFKAWYQNSRDDFPVAELLAAELTSLARAKIFEDSWLIKSPYKLVLFHHEPPDKNSYFLIRMGFARPEWIEDGQIAWETGMERDERSDDPDYWQRIMDRGDFIMLKYYILSLEEIGELKTNLPRLIASDVSEVERMTYQALLAVLREFKHRKTRA